MALPPVLCAMAASSNRRGQKFRGFKQFLKNKMVLAERDGESIMAILKQNVEKERPWYRLLYNSKGLGRQKRNAN